MVHVLADPSLYEYTGGQPPTLAGLTSQYRAQARGHSPDGAERWLNWIVLVDEQAVGYVQATVPADEYSAEVAWVIARRGKGATTAGPRPR